MKKTHFILSGLLALQSMVAIGQVDPDCDDTTENCLHFDGVNDYIRFGDVNDLGTSDFTIEAWVYLDGNGSNGSKIINKGLTTAGTPSNAGYGLRVHYGTSDLVQFSVGSSAGTVTTVSTVISGFNGSWHHIAGVRQGTTLSLYIDCQLINTATTSSVYNVNTSVPFAIGALVRNASSIDEYTEGKIDEVRIWNVARSHGDICKYSQEYFCSIPNGLLAYYHMNENTANGTNTGLTTVTDFAGSNNGTATNFSMIGSTSNWTNGYYLADPDPSVLDPSIFVSSETLFANVTTYSSYQWNDCDANNSPIIGETGTSYDPLYDGSYSLTVQDGCCEATSCCLQIDVKADYFNETENRLEVTFEEIVEESLIYPNPVNDIVNLKIEYNEELTCKVMVFDMNGKEHKSIDVQKNGLNSFNLSSLPQGNYLLVVQSGDIYKSYKFLKN